MPDSRDPGPFDGVESFYAEHRPGYGAATVDYLAERFDLDGTARVLDLGCGAGQLTLPLAARAGSVVGMDPNEEMLRRARRRAAECGAENVEWVVGSDADLHGGMGPFRLTAMGRSFHWMDQERTLDVLRATTEAGGGVALVTDREWLTKGTADWQRTVYDVVADHVADLPRRVHPDDVVYDDPWDEKLAAFGFTDVETVAFEVDREWSVDGVVGYVRSLSFCSPDRVDDAAALERDLRTALGAERDPPFEQRTAVEVVSGRRA